MASTALHSRPKYVFLLPWPVKPGTGVNNVVVGLRSAMSHAYEPEIVVTGWHEPYERQISLKMPGASLPIRNLVGFFAYFVPNMVRLRTIMRGAVAANPHFFGPEILPLAVLRRLGLVPRLILSVHGADVTQALQSSGIERKLYSWIYKTADVVIACSHALASDVRRVSPQANVKAIWNGISSPPQPRPQSPLKSCYIVSVAGFVKKKGHDVLLDAFAQLANTFPDLKLVLIGGDGPERGNVAAQIGRMGLQTRVEMLVDLPHEEVWHWVRHAECFALASREEPFGIAILEAALVHTPVIATAVGGVPEFLTDKVQGLLCRPEQPSELAAAITETLMDKTSARRRADNFYEHARKFTWQAAWEQYQSAGGLPQSPVGER